MCLFRTESKQILSLPSYTCAKMKSRFLEALRVGLCSHKRMTFKYRIMKKRSVQWMTKWKRPLVKTYLLLLRTINMNMTVEMSQRMKILKRQEMIKKTLKNWRKKMKMRSKLRYPRLSLMSRICIS